MRFSLLKINIRQLNLERIEQFLILKIRRKVRVSPHIHEKKLQTQGNLKIKMTKKSKS